MADSVPIIDGLLDGYANSKSMPIAETEAGTTQHFEE
jgi:hypothetical protein